MSEVGLIFPEGAAQQLTDVDKGLTAVDATCLRLVTTTNNLSTALKEGKISFEMLSKMQKQTEDTSKNLDAAAKKTIDNQQKLISLQKGEQDALLKSQKAIRDETQARNQLIKADGLAETSLVRMRQKLSQLTAEYDKSGKRTKEAANEINKLSHEIEDAEVATNRHGRGVAEYRSNLGRLWTGLINGTTTFKQFGQGIAAVGKQMLAFFLTPVGLVIAAMGTLYLSGRTLIKNAIEFQVAASELSALTGAVGKDLAFMKKQAREFAKESELSATEIVKAFTRVGSAIPVLLKMPKLLTEVTESVILLSESTQGKLSLEDAAMATTSAMNQFKIPLEESRRVVNALAAGSLLGSVRVNQLYESFQKGGPVLAASGLTMEQSIGTLEILGERFTQGADSGTAMKTMLMQLKASGLGYISGQYDMNDALDEAKEKLTAIQDPIKRDAELQDIFGKRGIIAGTILMEGTKALRERIKAIQELVAKGTIASDMAKISNDNLEASYKKLGNSWKELGYSVEDGSGAFSSAWKWIIDTTTLHINGLASGIDSFKSTWNGFLDWFRSAEKKEEIKKKEKEKEETEASKADAEVKKAEKVLAEEAVKALEASLQKEVLVIRQTQREKKASQEETNSLIMAKELEFYQKQLDVQKKAGLETIQVEQKIEGILAMMENNKETGGKSSKVENIKKINDEIRQDGYKINKDLLSDRENNEAEFEKLMEKEVNANDQKNDAIVKSSIEAGKKELNINTLLIEAAIADKQRQYEQELLIIDATSKNDTERRKRTFELNQKSITEEIAGIEKLLLSSDLETDQKIQLENKLKDLQLENNQLVADDDKQKHEEKVARQKEMVDMLINIGSAIFDFSIAKTQGELAALEDKNKKGLISDQEYAKQKSELEIKAAKQQRTKALFDIAVNTATAIVKVFPNFILMALAGALGAIQAATVMSQKLPVALAKGTKNAPSEFIAGEAGRELVTLKSGEILMANKATLFSGNKFKGATVDSNPETEKIMSRTNHQGYGAINFSDNRIVNGLSELNKTVKKKPVAIFQDGNYVGWQNDTHKEIYFEKLRRG